MDIASKCFPIKCTDVKLKEKFQVIGKWLKGFNPLLLDFSFER